jgi:hypothetical protein
VRRSILPALTALSLLTCTITAAAQGPPVMVAGRLADGAPPPVVDGRVADEAWAAAEPYSGFTQQDPIEGAPASERTEVRILLGRDTLYIGVIAFDSDPSRIIAAQSRRDAVLSNVDSIIIALDTFNDSQNAFVFGTNPLGIQYDGQVASEGQTSGVQSTTAGASGTQRGGISAFNANWDGDWDVKAQLTERGWEAELAIPLRTLRYATGSDRTWGVNVMRNIRHKNEQVYLAPIPRGFDIYRVSQAAKLTGLDLPERRDLKITPYVLGSVNKDFARSTDQLDRNGDIGGDLKWGIRPNLTLDVTVNTDFAQVEADEEQVNLTRFDLFFPEKRSFFLENASTFQFGSPQAIDLFFSRRIGLSATGQPIDILGGARLSGKIGKWNTGLLNIQTEDAEDRSGVPIAAANNFLVARAQREIGRSSLGAIVVNRQGTGERAGSDNFNRTYGVDGNWQASRNQRVSAFIARTDSPGAIGSDYAGRAFYNFTNNLWTVSGGVSQVGERFNPEVGFLPRRGYRRPEVRVFFQPQPKGIPWIRRIAPHMNYNAYYGFDGERQSSSAHFHPIEIQPAQGGRFGWYMDYASDAPAVPFTVYNRDGRLVSIASGRYEWWQQVYEYLHNPSSVVTGTARFRKGRYYNGDLTGFELAGETRIGTRFVSSVGWTRQDIDLPTGSFVTDLIPVKASYAFTTRANLQALVQYNGQTAQFSSNVRLALLDQAGTGFFIVYNDRRDTTAFTPLETLGRSFVIKYTRQIDF